MAEQPVGPAWFIPKSWARRFSGHLLAAFQSKLIRNPTVQPPLKSDRSCYITERVQRNIPGMARGFRTMLNAEPWVRNLTFATKNWECGRMIRFILYGTPWGELESKWTTGPTLWLTWQCIASLWLSPWLAQSRYSINVCWTNKWMNDPKKAIGRGNTKICEDFLTILYNVSALRLS